LLRFKSNKETLGLSDKAASRSVQIARSAVKEYLDRAAAAASGCRAAWWRPWRGTNRTMTMASQ
jgi:hypothetical protein